MRALCQSLQRPLFEQVLTGAKTLEFGEINSHQTSPRVSGTVSAGSNNSCRPILSTTLCQEHFICNISFNPHHHPRNCSRRKLRFKRSATPEGTQGATQWQRQDSAQPGLRGPCCVNRMLTPHWRGRGLLEERLGGGGGSEWFLDDHAFSISRTLEAIGQDAEVSGQRPM